MRRILTALSLLTFPALVSAQPNILLVIADDMGVDVSPCHAQGSNMVRMPTLKSLCDTGLVFENAHAHPTCSPTRANIVTGQYSSNTGIGAVVSERAPDGLSTQTLSLFDVLNENTNYATAVVGKWHLGPQKRDLSHPAKMGVGTYYGVPSGGVKNYFSWRGVQNGRPFQSTTYITTDLTNYAADWISKQDQPWMLWMAHIAPHSPFHAPPEELHSFKGLSTAALRPRDDPSAHYFAMLEALDTELARLLDGLPKAQRDNTVVIFIGDNGSPGQITRRLNTSRDAKGSIRDGGTHIPLVISGGGVPRGRSDAPAQVTDLFATILGLAEVGGQYSDSFDLLNGSPREATLIEHFNADGTRGQVVQGWAMSDGSYSLIAPQDGPLELYDVARDPRQANNLLNKPTAEHTSVAQRFNQLRDTYLQPSN